MPSVAPSASSARPGRAAVLLLVIVLELTGLSLAYQFLADIECDLTQSRGTCHFLRGMVLRALVVLGVAALLVRAWPEAFAEFLLSVRSHRSGKALCLHLAGVVLMSAPLLIFWGQNLSDGFTLAFVPWAAGAIAAVAGGLLWLAPFAAWRRMLWTRRHSALPILLLAAVVPDLVLAVQPIWDWQALATWTFLAVEGTLLIFGSDVYSEPAALNIGIDDFLVNIAPQCSGVEGFALVSVFVAIYAFVFRSEVRLGRFLLVMLPLGLLLSWMLNILRISLLIMIGARISPDIAVNGFHSYAGWLMFTCLAFGLVALAQNAGWLHRKGVRQSAPQPLRSDMVAAQLLPFALFMVTGTLVAAVFPHPGAGMPLTTTFLGLAVLFFLPVFRTLDWRPDGVSLVAGALVGLGWVLVAPAADDRLVETLAVLPTWGLGIWIATRIVGTVVLVPVVEEMFFRGYLLARLDGAHFWRRAGAVVISSAAFALLHGRWLEALLAGLVFAAIMLRRGRVSDAIWSHAVANGIVAAVAAWRGDWSLI
jgi:uncharacterized protein